MYKYITILGADILEDRGLETLEALWNEFGWIYHWAGLDLSYKEWGTDRTYRVKTEQLESITLEMKTYLEPVLVFGEIDEITTAFLEKCTQQEWKVDTVFNPYLNI